MNLSHFKDPDYVDLLESYLLIPHYLIHCFAYYEGCVSIIEDHQFDHLAKRLNAEWNKVEHPHKHLIDREALSSGGSYLYGKYPLIVINTAKDILAKLA